MVANLNGNGTALAKRDDSALELSPTEWALVGGDLSKMNEAQRGTLYTKVCESVGLNPYTQPFEYIVLNGKLRLYAPKNCTEQLRKLHAVSLQIVNRERVEGIYIVTARATMPNGRTDESTGAVSIEGVKGNDLANALMKAETKAKRRVTLSICGLGMLDESELETVADARRVANVPTVRTVDADFAPMPAPTVVEPAPAPAPEEETEDEQIAKWTARYDAVATVDDFKTMHREWLDSVRPKSVKDKVSKAYLAARERLGIQAVSRHKETRDVIVSMKAVTK